jgi:hypothetical protein
VEALLLLALIAATGFAGLAAYRLGAPSTWQTVQLSFGRDVADNAVIALLDAIGGLPHGRTVVLEMAADPTGISHRLSADQATLDSLRSSFRALLPSVRLEAIKEDAGHWTHGRAIRLRGRLRVLRTDTISETSAGLLAAFQPLGKSEALLLRWAIAPGVSQQVAATANGRPVPAEHQRLLRTKNGGTVLRASGLLAARTSHPARAGLLLNRVSSVLRSRSTAFGHLRTAPRRGRSLERALTSRRLWLGDRYSTSELAGLIGWPVDAPALPGVTLGTSPLLIPSPRLPKEGRVLGEATWPGDARPIAQPVVGALSHTLIAGPTGVGKSTLLANLISGDLAAGRGVVLIDGKGDTAQAVLARIPEGRAGDVIVLDCGMAGPQPGIKLLGGSDAELAADVVLGVLSDLFRDSWGPLSERYLRAGLLAIAHDPAGSLADVPFVYSDAAYRRRLVGGLSDPLTKATFAAFEAMGQAERQHQLAAPLNKLGSLLGRPIVRTVLGQTKPRLDFRTVLSRKQIVVVSLAPGRVGAPAARLIGALTVFALFQAVQARAALPASKRFPFLAYIDEPRALGDLPMPLDALLEQARGLGVGLTLAPQSMSQLPKPVRDAAFANIATRLVFRSSADDAHLLTRDMPGIEAAALGDLAAFEAVARIGLGPGDVAPVVSLRTLPPVRPTSDPRALRKASADRWGVSLAEVDQQLQARHQATPNDAPVGRRRRQA